MARTRATRMAPQTAHSSVSSSSATRKRRNRSDTCLKKGHLKSHSEPSRHLDTYLRTAPKRQSWPIATRDIDNGIDRLRHAYTALIDSTNRLGAQLRRQGKNPWHNRAIVEVGRYLERFEDLQLSRHRHDAPLRLVETQQHLTKVRQGLERARQKLLQRIRKKADYRSAPLSDRLERHKLTMLKKFGKKFWNVGFGAVKVFTAYDPIRDWLTHDRYHKRCGYHQMRLAKLALRKNHKVFHWVQYSLFLTARAGQIVSAAASLLGFGGIWGYGLFFASYFSAKAIELTKEWRAARLLRTIEKKHGTHASEVLAEMADREQKLGIEPLESRKRLGWHNYGSIVASLSGTSLRLLSLTGLPFGTLITAAQTGRSAAFFALRPIFKSRDSSNMEGVWRNERRMRDHGIDCYHPNILAAPTP